MEVGIGITWEIVVDCKVDALNIDTATEDISGDANALLEVLECLVAANTVVND